MTDFVDDLKASLGSEMADDDLANEVYAALCNTTWRCDGAGEFACTWRAAGAIVAEIRDKGEDYLDFYCSGGEGIVSDRVRDALGAIGWKVVDER